MQAAIIGAAKASPLKSRIARDLKPFRVSEGTLIPNIRRCSWALTVRLCSKLYSNVFVVMLLARRDHGILLGHWLKSIINPSAILSSAKDGYLAFSNNQHISKASNSLAEEMPTMSCFDVHKLP